MDMGAESRTRRGYLNTWIVLSVAAVAVLAPKALAQQLVLTNPLDLARLQEVVEVPLKQVLNHLHLSAAQASAIVAADAITGVQIPGQLYSSKPGADPDLLPWTLPGKTSRSGLTTSLTLMRDQGDLADPAIGLTRSGPLSYGQPHQLFARPVHRGQRSSNSLGPS